MLDHAISTATALADVAASVDVPIIADSGINSAADVVKALSLGASVAAIGRLAGWGLAAGGADALVEMLELLQWDISDVMTLIGAATVGELDASVLVQEPFRG